MPRKEDGEIVEEDQFEEVDIEDRNNQEDDEEEEEEEAEEEEEEEDIKQHSSLTHRVPLKSREIASEC